MKWITLNTYLRYLLFVIALGAAIPSFSQDKKLLKQKIKLSNDVEQYEVLKSNREVKYGTYELTWNWKFYKAIKVKGQYIDNQKTGEWVYYYSHPGRYGKHSRPEYVVNYRNNLLHGEFFRLSTKGDTLEVRNYLDGKPSNESRKYQYDTLVEHYNFTSKQNLLPTKNMSRPDASPNLVDDVDISRYIYNNIDLPPPHKDSSMYASGQIQIEFIIDTDSTLHSPVLQKGANERVDTALLKCIKQTKWTPALKNGKTVPVKTTLLIAYEIEWQGRGKNRLFFIKHYIPANTMETLLP